MSVYRNQTPTLAQIQAMSRMRITKPQEAVAFLRAVAPLNEQVAFVLQRASLREQQNINKSVTVDYAPEVVEAEPTPVQEIPKTFVPEDLSSDEGFSDSDVEKKVAKLKAASKTTKSKTTKSKTESK